MLSLNSCPHHLIPIFDHEDQKSTHPISKLELLEPNLIGCIIQFCNSKDIKNLIEISHLWKNLLLSFIEVKETIKFNRDFSHILSPAYQKSPVQYHANITRNLHSLRELENLSQHVTNKLSENPNTLRNNKCQRAFKILFDFDSLIFSSTTALFSTMVVHKEKTIASLNFNAEDVCESFLNVTQHCFSTFKKANLSEIYDNSFLNETVTDVYVHQLREIDDEIKIENDRWRNSIGLIIWASSKLLYSLAKSWGFQDNKTIHKDFERFTYVQKVSCASSAITFAVSSIFIIDAENYGEEYIYTACALNLLATGIDYLYYKRPYQLLNLRNKLCNKINRVFHSI